jgi:hypothetical protein
MDRKDYLAWKRKNVTLRGLAKDKRPTHQNGGSSYLGGGLYTCPLSNRQMARSYAKNGGSVWFVVYARPLNPKVFNTCNDWEIWLYNNLIKSADAREFYKTTSIEAEMLKLGFDGIEIKGREIVNFKPDEDRLRWFEDERQLEQYYEWFIEQYSESAVLA